MSHVLFVLFFLVCFFFKLKYFYIFSLLYFSFFLLEGLAVSDTDHNKSGQKTGEKGIYISVMKM